MWTLIGLKIKEKDGDKFVGFSTWECPMFGWVCAKQLWGGRGQHLYWMTLNWDAEKRHTICLVNVLPTHKLGMPYYDSFSSLLKQYFKYNKFEHNEFISVKPSCITRSRENRQLLHTALRSLCRLGSSCSRWQRDPWSKCRWRPSNLPQPHLLWNTQNWTEEVRFGILGSCSQQN